MKHLFLLLFTLLAEQGFAQKYDKNSECYWYPDSSYQIGGNKATGLKISVNFYAVDDWAVSLGISNESDAVIAVDWSSLLWYLGDEYRVLLKLENPIDYAHRNQIEEIPIRGSSHQLLVGNYSDVLPIKDIKKAFKKIKKPVFLDTHLVMRIRYKDRAYLWAIDRKGFYKK